MSHTFQVFRFWDIHNDCEAARISIFDARGDEFFRVIHKHSSGKAWREERERAVEAIVMAMEQGLQPGEVVIDG